MVEMVTLASLFGVSLGSFVNACAYRIPRNLPVVELRSFCPSCRKSLSWYELIPVISFLLSRGKCRNCAGPISLQYPFIEIATGGLTVFFLLQLGFSFQFIYAVSISLLMILIALVDWKHLIIPNVTIVIGFIIGIFFKIFFFQGDLNHDSLSAFGSFSIVFAILLAGNIILGKPSMGMGDVKLAGLIGFFLGFLHFLVVFWIATVMGLMFSLFRRGDKDKKIPFGSFLATSSIIVLMFQEHIKNSVDVWFSWIQ